MMLFGNCANCNTETYLEEHHIVPKALGGTENNGNKVFCVVCVTD